MPQNAWEGQSIALWSWFFPSTFTWPLRIDLGSSGLHREHFYWLNCLIFIISKRNPQTALQLASPSPRPSLSKKSLSACPHALSFLDAAVLTMIFLHLEAFKLSRFIFSGDHLARCFSLMQDSTWMVSSQCLSYSDSLFFLLHLLPVRNALSGYLCFFQHSMHFFPSIELRAILFLPPWGFLDCSMT